ncbi:hypothetical protein ACI2IP_04110 [Microbacterium sp. NPDC090218]
MPENAPTPSTGPSRRTVLKTTAWALPVVAAAVATPLAAASLEGDLQLVARPGGTTIGANDPGATEAYVLTIPPGFDVNSLGTTQTPAGSTLTVRFDSRLFGGPVVTMDGTSAGQLPPVSTGNTTEVTFVLPYGIPSNETNIPILVSFTTTNNGMWVTDAEPYVVTLVAPSGSNDPNSGNNTFTAAAEYSPVVPI